MHWDLIFSNAIYAAIAVNAIGYCLIAVGLNVHFGYTGLLNFGQAGFAAIGAYAVAVPIARYGWSLWATIPIILVGGLVLGLILGVPTLRLRADYLAIVTIAAAEIIRLVLGSERFRWLFGGQDGLQGYTQQLQDLNPFGDDRITVWAQNFGGYDLFIIVVGWIIVALTSLLVWSLMRSPWGRVLKSIREDEDAARSLGKNVFSYKMQSLVVGGIIGALGGTVIAVGNRAAQPGNYSTTLTFFAFTILILGGVARVKGPIVGAMIFWFTITFVDNVLAEAVRADSIPGWLDWLNITNANFGQVKYIIAGAALAVLVVFRPQGIFGDPREQAFDVR